MVNYRSLYLEYTKNKRAIRPNQAVVHRLWLAEYPFDSLEFSWYPPLSLKTRIILSKFWRFDWVSRSSAQACSHAFNQYLCRTPRADINTSHYLVLNFHSIVNGWWAAGPTVVTFILPLKPRILSDARNVKCIIWTIILSMIICVTSVHIKPGHRRCLKKRESISILEV